MKKTSLLLIVSTIVLAGALQAQTPGSTPLRHIPSNYFATPHMTWDESDTNKCSTAIQFWAHGVIQMRIHIDDSIDAVGGDVGNFIVGNQLTTDRPIKIVGIGACGYMQRPSDTTFSFFMNRYESAVARENNTDMFILNTRDTSVATRFTDSLILYKPIPGGDMRRLASAPWRIEQQHENIVLPPEYSPIYYSYFMNGIWDSTASPSDWGWFMEHEDPAFPHVYDPAPVVPLYEAYFDTPVVVEDTFVVAGTALNNDGSYGWETLPIWPGHRERMWLWDHNPTRYRYLLNFYPCDQPTVQHQYWWVKFRHHQWVKFGHGPHGKSYYEIPALIFPIIDLDFDTTIEHCQQVTSVSLVENTDSTATLMWDAVNSVRWEVKYGMVGLDEANYTVQTTSAPTITLRGLNTHAQYKVYVRGWCPCDSSWGAWSNPKIFRLQTRGGGTEGIEESGDLSRYTRLLPNPARGKVSIISSLRLSRVEIYDLQGRRVMTQEAKGVSAVVDISQLAPGTYIAALHTSAGIVTKKLRVL